MPIHLNGNGHQAARCQCAQVCRGTCLRVPTEWRMVTDRRPGLMLAYCQICVIGHGARG